MDLITRRLTLRELRPSDYEALCEIESDPEVMRYERPALTGMETRDRLEYALKDAQADPRTRFRFAVTVRPDDRLQGWVSCRLNIPEVREYEIGWTIKRALWGQGYATEGAHEVMRFGFYILNAHRFVAFCHAGNRASRRVMEKLHMQYEGRLREVRRINDMWEDEFVYGILEREFLK